MKRFTCVGLVFFILFAAIQIAVSQWSYGWRWDKHYDVRALPPHTSLHGLNFSDPVVKNGIIRFSDDNRKKDSVDLYRQLCTVVLDSAAGKYRFFPQEFPNPNVDFYNLDEGRKQTSLGNAIGTIVEFANDTFRVRRIDPVSKKAELINSVGVQREWKGISGKPSMSPPVFCSSDLGYALTKENSGKTLCLYSLPDLTFKGAIIGDLYRREYADIDTLESMFDETNYALRAFQKEDIANMHREKFSIIDQTMTGRELTIRSDEVYRLVIFAPDSAECLLSFDEFDNIGNSRTSFLTASGTTFTPGAPAPAGRLVWKNLLARYEVNLASDKGYHANCRLTVAPRAARFKNSALFFNFNKVYSMLIYKKKRDGTAMNLTIKEMPYTEYKLPPAPASVSSSIPAGQEVCPKCNGSRTMVATGKATCSRCSGRGTVRCSLCDGTKRVYDVYQRITKGCPQCAIYGAQLCPDCRGERSLPFVDTGVACSECKGAGYVAASKKQGAKKK